MKRVMGFWRCWGLVVGIVIGNGIFMLPAVLAPYGKLSLLAWIIAGIGTIFIALMLGTLAKRHSMQGGFYAYTRETFGDLSGYLIAWGYWISILTAMAAGAIAVTGYLGYFIPRVATDPIIGAVIALALIWLTTAITLTGMKTACTFQLVTSVLKLLPLFAIAVGGLFIVDITPSLIETNEPEPTLFLISTMVMITMWAYVGIEAVTLPSDDVINPEKNIPRALILGTLTVTVIYIVLSYSVMALIPQADLVKSTSPLADAASVIFGPWGAGFIAVGALISMLSNINGNTLIVCIMPSALSKDKLIPEFFSQKNEAGVAVKSLVISACIASLLVIMNFSDGLLAAYKVLILLSTLTVLLPYAVSALIEIVLQIKENSSTNKINVKTFTIAVVAFIFSIFAIIGSGLTAALQGILLLAAGLPFYYWSKRTKQDI